MRPDVSAGGWAEGWRGRLNGEDARGHRAVGQADFKSDRLERGVGADRDGARIQRAMSDRSAALSRRGAVRGIGDRGTTSGGTDDHRLRPDVGAGSGTECWRRCDPRNVDCIYARDHRAVGKAALERDSLQRGVGANRNGS